MPCGYTYKAAREVESLTRPGMEDVPKRKIVAIIQFYVFYGIRRRICKTDFCKMLTNTLSLIGNNCISPQRQLFPPCLCSHQVVFSYVACSFLHSEKDMLSHMPREQLGILNVRNDAIRTPLCSALNGKGRGHGQQENIQRSCRTTIQVRL